MYSFRIHYNLYVKVRLNPIFTHCGGLLRIEAQLLELLTCDILDISDLIYDFPDDDLQKVET